MMRDEVTTIVARSQRQGINISSTTKTILIISAAAVVVCPFPWLPLLGQSKRQTRPPPVNDHIGAYRNSAVTSIQRPLHAHAHHPKRSFVQ